MLYKMYAASSPGAKYRKKGWTCQDSSFQSSFGRVQMIAVADGHGSPDCFRSEHGSRIAIEAAFRQVEKFCTENNFQTDGPALFSGTGISNFKYAFLEDWKKSVRNHWYEYLDTHDALGEDEIRYSFVSDKYKERYTSEDSVIVEKYLYTAYGTTLLMAVSIGTQILILQIGDGTCVMLQRDGTFSVPVPEDEGNFLNVTVSVCEKDAFRKIRYAVIDCNSETMSFPAALFLSTDGVDDCYPYYQNEKYLYKMYRVFLDNILKEGFEATEKELTDNVLSYMTDRGSKDDISLAYFVTEDLEILKEAVDRIQAD